MAKIHRQGISFRRLVHDTLLSFWGKKKGVSVSVLSFALLLGMVTTFTEQRAQRLQDRIAEQQGVSWQELQSRIDAAMIKISESDGTLLLTRMRQHGFQADSLDFKSQPEDIALVFIAALGPWILLSFLLNACILFLASVFFLLFAGSASLSGYDAARHLPMMTMRMLSLLLLSFFRSFVWIPFAGPVIGLWMFPRLALAPAILLSGKQGALQSFRESMKRTKGRWFQTTFSLIGLGLITLGFAFILIVPISMFALVSLKLSFFLWLLLLITLVAFQMFFLAGLSEGMKSK